MPESRVVPKSGNLPTTLATWIFLLDRKGVTVDDPELRGACLALADAAATEGPATGGAEQSASLDALGQVLVSRVQSLLGSEGAGPDGVVTLLNRLFGAAHVVTYAGTSREERLVHARAYEFRSALPWLAQIIDRFPDGTVGPHWVMVERVTDVVTCMDPYPWDDLDEEYQVPLTDFMVKWELADCPVIRWVA